MAVDREPSFEESVDALEEGDAPIEINAARAALANRDFRVVWLGAMASNVGTWMQNVTLGAFAYKLTGSSTFVGITAMAQLGPVLFLSLIAGALADVRDRRKLILVAQTEQLLASVVLAIVAAQHHPNKVALLLSVLSVGIGNALNAPAWNAMLPTMVDREHLAGAVSLNSTQMNLSRVIGPVIGGILYPALGAAAVFGVNAATYVFAIVTLLMISSPPFVIVTDGTRGMRRIAEGIRAARQDIVVRRCIVTISLMALFSLPFLSLLPTIAHDNLGIDPKSFQYGALYASFGIGTVAGAISTGTFLSRQDLRRLVQIGLAAMSLVLLTLMLLRQAAPAYPVAVMLGFVYFGTVTSLTTVLQGAIPDHLRGRVMSLWQMGFAGFVPVGVLLGGIIADHTSIRVVLLYGAIACAILCRYARLRRQ